ncbi:MAG: hypothetical protein WCA13_15895 [Terriglobales bacterium]
MTASAENQEVKLVYGMRGGIPSDRMEQIHFGLPYSMRLREMLPYLADPLAAPLDGVGKMRARVRLSYGWHMLNQARIALVEAEACTVFYEEFQHNHTEALYRCQYYLDDAALRLHSSCEHMLRSVVFQWTLSTREKVSSVDADASSKESRESLLVGTLKAAEQSKHSQVRVDVAKLLRQLRSSNAWKACINHRNDWVHNRLPAIKGLFPDIGFGTFDYEKELPPAISKLFGVKQGIKMSVGIGTDINLLRETVRNAYGELFRVYEGLAKLLAKGFESTPE